VVVTSPIIYAGTGLGVKRGSSYHSLNWRVSMEILRPTTELLWFGTVDDGKKLLVNATLDGKSYDLATIVADDEDESLWFEIYVGEKIVQIPLHVIQKAIESAPGEVHSESWYENNIYSKE
jgi:hypothetical protein